MRAAALAAVCLACCLATASGARQVRRGRSEGEQQAVRGWAGLGCSRSRAPGSAFVWRPLSRPATNDRPEQPVEPQIQITRQQDAACKTLTTAPD